MKPLYERVLIRPRAKETTLESGIMLPEKAVKRPNIGTVIAVGDGTPHQPMLVKVGDIVLCNRFAGADLTFKGEKCQMVLSNEIIAVIDKIEDISLEEYD